MTTINCPICHETLELPDGSEGVHLQCPRCQKKFVVKDGIARALAITHIQSVSNPQPNKPTKPINKDFTPTAKEDAEMPGLLKLVHYLLYFFAAYEIVNFICSLIDGMAYVLSMVPTLCLLAFIVISHMGYNIGRIIVSMFFTVCIIMVTITIPGSMNTPGSMSMVWVLYLILLPLIIIPWLPSSSRWYRIRKQARHNGEKLKLDFSWLALTIAVVSAIIIYVVLSRALSLNG